MRSAPERPRLGPMCVAAAVTILLTACSGPVEPERPAILKPELPRPDPVLTRVDLLAAVGRTTSAFASGGAYPSEVAALSGRRFEVGMPFGCDGPTPETTPEPTGQGYSVSPDGRAMTLIVQPTRWQEPFWLSALADSAQVEAAEGFWLRRPWLASAGCPGKTPLMQGAQPSPETVGLVRTFEAGGSRLNRRGDRPYRTTVRTEPDRHLGLAGFRLVLEGRIADATGRPIRCRSRSVDERPTCLVRVAFERISIRTQAGEVLAEWRE